MRENLQVLNQIAPILRQLRGLWCPLHIAAQVAILQHIWNTEVDASNHLFGLDRRGSVGWQLFLCDADAPLLVVVDLTT